VTNAAPRVNPLAMGARIGDIVHTRGLGVYAKGIRRCLPDAWGNHDGTLVYHGNGWGVAEALLSGFRVTPWEEYLDQCERGMEMAFLRPIGLPPAVAIQVQYWALEMAARRTRYNLGGILRIWWQIATRANLGEGRQEWDWYCTQAVRQQHIWAGSGPRWDVWAKELPTPYTTEKRIVEGTLDIVTSTSHPDWDFGAVSLARHLEKVAARA